MTELTNSYPSEPIWSDNMKFRIGVIPAMRDFKAKYPYSVGMEARRQGLAVLLETLSGIYEIEEPELEFTEPEKETSWESYYSEDSHKIVMVGKLSIITFLHEFAHCRGFDEVEAVKWSLSLFKRIFPIAFDKLTKDKHMLVEKEKEVVNG